MRFLIIMFVVACSCNDNSDINNVKYGQETQVKSCLDTFELKAIVFSDRKNTHIKHYRVIGNKNNISFNDTVDVDLSSQICDTIGTFETLNDTIIGPIKSFENGILNKIRYNSIIDGKYNFQELICFNKEGRVIDSLSSPYIITNLDSSFVSDLTTIEIDLSKYFDKYDFLKFGTIKFIVNSHIIDERKIDSDNSNITHKLGYQGELYQYDRMMIEVILTSNIDEKDGLRMRRFYSF